MMNGMDEPTADEMEQLRPCRGCGRKPMLLAPGRSFQFLCNTPGCYKPSPSREEAVRAWNERRGAP